MRNIKTQATHEEEQDPGSASRPSLCHHEKGSGSSSESISREIAHAANTHTYAKLHETPMTLPRTNIEKTLGKYSKKYVDGFATVSGHLCSSFYLTTLITKVLFLDDLI